MKRRKIKVGQLVLDEKLLQIRSLNSFVVSHYRQLYRMGTVMPPIVVESKTNRITSGNHRAKALLMEYGPDYEIEVIFKSYDSEKDRLLDFTRENAAHGYPLDGTSRKLVTSALLAEGVTAEEISLILGITVERLERKGDENVVVLGKSGQQEVLPVKRCFPKNLAAVTEEQYREHRYKDMALPPVRLADQLIRWLKNDWIDRTESNLNALILLHGALGDFLAAPKPVLASQGAGQELGQVS